MNPYEYRRESDFQRFVRNRKRVPVNTFLILANLLVFFAVELTGSALSTSHMYRWGAAYAPAIVQGREYYRLVTSMFLHFGIQHLGNNMLVLFFLGDCLERNLGRWKYAFVYMAGGVGANLLSLFVELKQGQEVVSAGASGAVFAVIGALIYVVLVNKGRIENFTVRQLVLMAALSLYHGVTSVRIDNAAHFGGLICGLFLGILLYRKPRTRH